MDYIPVNTPLIGKLEKDKIIECIESGWISSEGPYVSEFEEKFCGIVKRKFGIAVSSGTAALDIAVAALGIGYGDEVILPTFSIISCSAAIVRSGAKPVLVDCDLDTWNMDVNSVRAKISSKTKAIMVVHTYGLPVDMNPIKDLAKEYKLFIIEDAAEMHGQFYFDKPCGSFGEISTFSFYPNKHITTGEGGMIVSDDPIIAERCRSLRNLCFQKDKRFVHEEIGWNYRMTSLQAAIGIVQIDRLEENIRKKRDIGRRYTKNLMQNNHLLFQLTETKFAKNIYWVFGMILKNNSKNNAKDFMNYLSSYGIGTRPFFWPVHKQPVFKKKGWFKDERYKNSELMASNGFYVPSGLGITNEQIDYVSEKINQFFDK
tara:strand:+ start:1131 stop:2249 length:1119 start_codon:yes stop_codon:yes gene_type:complete